MRLLLPALRAATRGTRGLPLHRRTTTPTHSLPHRTRTTLSPSHRGLSTTATKFTVSPDTAGDRKWSTPLAERLAQAIDLTEPMPLARFMRMCLTSDVGGYYTRGDLKDGQDQFGVEGDFVTSPEISQIFGELVGIWFAVEWLSQGKPDKGVELIEVGPGRGTLMDDILRVGICQNSGFHSTIGVMS